MVNGYCKYKRIDKAMELFLEMYQNGLVLDCVIYNALINYMSQVERLSVAQELFKEMCAHGLVPYVITYCTT